MGTSSSAAKAESAAEAFNRAMGMERIRNPYPRWAEMRRQGPVHRIDLSQSTPPYVRPGEDPSGFMVVGYALAAEVLRDARRFPSSKYQDTTDAVIGKNILAMDPPEHTRYRAMVQQGFTRKALVRWEGQVMLPVTHQYIDRFAERGRAELVHDLAFEFPAHVIARLFGFSFSRSELERFQELSIELQTVLFDFERGVRASQELTEIFLPVLAAHRTTACDDLLGLLLDAELDGERLDEDEILGFMRLLLPAGLETTYRALSNTLFGLLTHPEQLEALRRDPTLMDRALEEGLRWEPPMTTSLRFVAEDAELAGERIPAGSKILVNLGAANRDPSRFERPEEFDLFRRPRPHLTFGFGPHRCLGLQIAMMEMRAGIGCLLDRLPDLRLDPEADDVHIRGEGFRAPLELPVVFGTPAR
jgi:cytochrome P450